MRGWLLVVVTVAIASASCKRVPRVEVMAAWREVKLPLEAGESWVSVERVRGLAADDVWVVGTAGGDGRRVGVAYHYDGTSWTRTPITSRATSSVFPISHDDVWAVGAYGTVAHWDGHDWTGQKLEGVNADLFDVAGHDGDLYASTSRTVLHFDGRRWHDFVKRDAVGSLNVLPSGAVAITGALPHGERGFDSARDAQLESTRMPGRGTIRIVAASSTSDVWAVGWNQTANHFDGTAWEALPLPAPYTLDVAAISSARAYLVGSDGIVVRWDRGVGMRRVAFPNAMDIWTIYAPPGAGPYVGGSLGLFQLAE